jgi:hypothetical protein
MDTAFIVWGPILFGALQVLAFFAVGRNLWPFLRKNAPRVLAYRGDLYFFGTLLLLVVLPAIPFVVIASHYIVGKPLIIVRLTLTKFWIAGLALGLSLAASYYGPKDLQTRRRRRRSALPTPKA